MRSHLPLTLIVALALGACGDDADQPAASTSAPATATPATASVPAEIVGTWTTRLPVSEIPDAPNELIGASPEWELKILADGGVDGAPSFTIVNKNEEIGSIGSSTFSADPEQIKIVDDDCAEGVQHAYTLEGDELVLQPAAESECRDPLYDAILSTNAWKRAGASEEAALPAGLVGTWTAKLPLSDIPDPPADLKQASSSWRVEIGGDDEASLRLINGDDAVGTVVDAKATARGDRVTLVDPDHDCGTSTLNSEYVYAVEGDELTFSPTDIRSCSVHTIEVILTSQPWRREG